MIYPGEGKKGQPKVGDYVLAAERVRAEAAADPHRSTAVDLARADRWEADPPDRGSRGQTTHRHSGACRQ